jgi:2,3-bisphosphoglycerate-independent phosphoglycerate mutase
LGQKFLLNIYIITKGNRWVEIKYVVLVPDGAADYPLDELDGKTPLQAAITPQMDFLASNGFLGRAETIPKGMSPGSDVANLSLLGYDPKKYYSGRGPLEAASMGITLDSDDTAFRCNLVTVENGILKDYSAGHISTPDAAILIKTIQNNLGNENFTFYPGVSYRHLMVTKGDFSTTLCLPPHDVVDKTIDTILPIGKGSKVLKELMLKSVEVLEQHEVNRMRQIEKKNSANMIWLWGQGKAPSIPSFKEKYGLEGGVISAVDLIKGIGRYAGLEIINVPGATGYFDTDYLAKAQFALDVLKQNDFVFVHVEAPDEAGHIGNIKEKIRAIENFDKKIVKPIFEGLKKLGDFKIMIVPDHPTPINVKTHTSDPVPWLIYRSLGKITSGVESFCEASVKDRPLYFEEGFKLMDFFIND